MTDQRLDCKERAVPFRWMIIVAAAALGASAGASGQSKVDRAFNATGATCNQITWSKASLAKYPKMGSACRQVVQRDGKFFVKFHGEVHRVTDDGQRVTVNLKGGDQLTLAPAQRMSLYIDSKRTPIQALQPGDQLNFYVPEDQLTAEFFRGDIATSTAQKIPVINTLAASAAEPGDVAPALGVVGLLLTVWPRH